MSLCPYTWFTGILGRVASPSNKSEASFLRVTVRKDDDLKVNVALPAASARWLIDLIPDDVMAKIREEGIPIDEIQADLAKQDKLIPQKIFLLTEKHRAVEVWLE